jgi:pSer/pThr/pTyr-binding forkhead associated (FHA) protein
VITLRLQLSYQDPITDSPRQPTVNTPIAFGSEFTAMPGVIEDQRVSRIILGHPSIQAFHALLDEQEGQLWVTDQQTVEGVLINGSRQDRSVVRDGDRLQIGSCEILVHLLLPSLPTATPTPETTISSTPPTVRSPPLSSDGVCHRLVGFLFPRRCGRTNRVNCPHCDGGRVSQDPYFLYPERSFYVDFGNYRETPAAIDFTDADAAVFENTDIDFVDFEQDMGAS